MNESKLKVYQMKTFFFRKLSLFTWTFLSFICLSSLKKDTIPQAHKKALEKMTNSYQKELNRVIPLLVKNAANQQGTFFTNTFFLNDDVQITNHLIPRSVKADEKVVHLIDKKILNPLEFISLIAGSYKLKFSYKLKNQANVLQSIDSSALVYRYQQRMFLTITGQPHERMSIELNDTLNFITEINTDIKHRILSTKIVSIQQTDTSYIKPDSTKIDVIATNEESIIDWNPEKKLKTFIGYLTLLKDDKDSTSQKLDKIIADCNSIFDLSGFVNLTTKEGKNLRIAREEFLRQVFETKNEYVFNFSKISLYDNFRKDEFNKWFCRITTFHEVAQFDDSNPIATKVTSVASMPAKGDCISSKGGYYQLAEVWLKEL